MKISHRTIILSIALLFINSNCGMGGPLTITPSLTNEASQTSSPTLPLHISPTPQSKKITVSGPDFPDGFDQTWNRKQDIILRADDTLEIMVGSTPSIPCHWQSPEIGDNMIMQQVAHKSRWPAPDVTPKPGASGLEIWRFKALEQGRTEIHLKCMGLN